VLPNGAERLLF